MLDITKHIIEISPCTLKENPGYKINIEPAANPIMEYKVISW